MTRSHPCLVPDIAFDRSYCKSLGGLRDQLQAKGCPAYQQRKRTLADLTRLGQR